MPNRLTTQVEDCDLKLWSTDNSSPSVATSGSALSPQAGAKDRTAFISYVGYLYILKPTN